MDQGMSAIERKSIRKEYFSYLIPTVIGQVAHSCYCLADVFFVGRGVGKEGLAALNVALPIFTVYTTFSLLVGVGAATTISVCRGEGNDEHCNRVFTMALWAIVLIGGLLSVIGGLYLRQIAYLFGATDLIVDGVVDYLRPIAPLAVVYMLTSMLSVVIRSDGNPRLVMIAGTAGNLTNIALDYLFVLPLGMGIFGAGLATIIGPCLALLLLSLHFVKRYNHITLMKKAFHKSLFWRMLRNGLGSGVLETSAGFVILLFNLVLLRVSGETAVAIFSLISNIAYVGKGIFNGMAQAAQPMIGISYGQRDFARMRVVNRCAMLTAFAFSLAVLLLIAAFPARIMSFFIPVDETILQIGTLGILLYFLSFPFTGVNTVLMYYFQSIERPLLTFAVAILRGIALVWLALTIFSALWGITGVWLALLAAEGITFLLFYPIKLRLDCQAPDIRN